jgi:uncharacterized protein YndB with AHSA1/START domain
MTSGSDANRVVITRRLRATREELFDAWLNPEGMQDWMCPGNILSVEVHMEPRVGGALLIIMRDTAGTYEHRGEFTIIDRPSKLAFTWIAAATDQRSTLVTVEFVAIDENWSELVLTHERFPRKDVSDQYRGGWNRILERLEVYLQRLQM